MLKITTMDLMTDNIFNWKLFDSVKMCRAFDLQLKRGTLMLNFSEKGRTLRLNFGKRSERETLIKETELNLTFDRQF